MVVHYNSLPIVVKFAHSLPTDGEKRSCTCQIRIGKEAGTLADTILGTGTSVCNRRTITASPLAVSMPSSAHSRKHP